MRALRGMPSLFFFMACATALGGQEPKIEVEAGFEVVRIETFLQEDNIYIARPKPAGK